MLSLTREFSSLIQLTENLAGYNQFWNNRINFRHLQGSILKRIIPYIGLLKPVQTTFWAAILCGLLFGISTGLGLPYMLKKVFPVVFGSQEVTGLILLSSVALIPLSFLVRGVTGFFNVYFINVCGVKILEQLRRKIFVKLQELPASFHQKHPIGDLQSRAINDTELLQNFVLNIANDLLKQPTTLLCAIGYLTYLTLEKPELSYVLLCLLVIPMCIFPIRKIGRRIQYRAKALQRQTGDLSATLTENLTAQREIRAFNLQKKEEKKFRDLIVQLFNLRLKLIKYNHLIAPTVEVIASIGIAASIYHAARVEISLEDLTPIIMALYLSYEPIKKLGSIYARIRQCTAALDRIEYILDHPIEIEDPKQPEPFENIKGKVEFQNVEFSYDNDSPALNKIDVTVNAGQIVALVGPSGAGKTTFANLLMRFHDPSSGKVQIDGKDLRSITQADLRSHIAYVPQNPILFNDSVRNNILLGKTNSSHLTTEEAGRKAYAHEFIEDLPDGYNTQIGERGSRLSGGQIQRIAIARALIRNAPILILDEATSALDSESEQMIQKALRNLVEGKTVFIIAHRFSTISLADRILVFENGRTVGDGTQKELIKECDLYRRLHDGQK